MSKAFRVDTINQHVHQIVYVKTSEIVHTRMDRTQAERDMEAIERGYELGKSAMAVAIGEQFDELVDSLRLVAEGVK